MSSSAFTPATHLSIIWGITLAVMTLMEWHSLDRDPVRQEILSPFIERHIAVTVQNGATPAAATGEFFEPEDAPDAVLRYDVELGFNGPLFLACFFIPIIIAQGISLLWQRIRRA